jgi:hypothetical protein
LYPSSASNFSSALAIAAVLCFRASEDIDTNAEGDYVARFICSVIREGPKPRRYEDREKHSRRNKKPHGVFMGRCIDQVLSLVGIRISAVRRRLAGMPFDKTLLVLLYALERQTAY